MDYYEVLQLSKTASKEEIKKAYRKLSRKYHPDNAGERGRKIFDQVQEAYAVLGDEEKKAVYDRKMAGSSPADTNKNIKKMQAKDISPVNINKLFESFFKLK